MRRGLLRPALLAALALAALAGCGAGAGDAPDAIRLTVTRDFGARDVGTLQDPEVSGADTVMRLLQRNLRVTTRYGGGFVQSIAGVTGGRRGGRPVDWFYYVNGVEAERGATAVRVRPGDRVWWDHRDWGATLHVPAVVGSFPEPFVHGIGGKRLPVRVECADPAGAACTAVADRLVDRGVIAARARLGGVGALESLRVLVGPWPALRRFDDAAQRVDRGPELSGVFARFDRSGRTLTVLDARGRPARRLGAGSGLVAATRVADRRPVWFVTGTDAAGVESAARALDESALTERYALAIAGDRAVRVPEGAR